MPAAGRFEHKESASGVHVMALARLAGGKPGALHREMEYAVYISHCCVQHTRIQNRAVHHSRVALGLRSAQVIEVASREVIEHGHVFAAGNKCIDEMTSDETCPARNKDAAVHGERAFCLTILRRVASSDACACSNILTTLTPCRPSIIDGEGSLMTLANSSTTALNASRLTMRGKVTSPMR